jgi:hypoxanthine phosphoribosyltransferase
MYDSRIEEVLFTKTEIENKCHEIGETLSSVYKGKTPIFICMLRGAVPFFAELVKNVTIDIEMDYMYATSYQGTQSKGILDIRLDPSTDISGREVLIVDDIIDTGFTLSQVYKEFIARGASNVKICTLLNKPNRKNGITIDPDFYGFDIPVKYVVGFGMDYNNIMRNLPYIGILKKEFYER